MKSYLLAIDQGTTNSRAIIFNEQAQLICQHEMSLNQSYPHSAWVEQDPEEMFNNTVLCCQRVLKKSGLSASQIAAIGISNQRETTIIWDKKTGRAIYPAIVWQDRRTSEICEKIPANKITIIFEKTGLMLDPYFSASKILWILDNVPGAREQAEREELLFGTVDCYLLWKLTAGKSHATDATNASRTMLFNIHHQCWDKELLELFRIPHHILPSVFDNTADYGETHQSFFGESIQIAGMAGDQQAATIGQACFQSGMVKATYGTGCFMLLNTGPQLIASQNRLLSTVAYRLNKQVTYGLEGSIFSAGSIIKWLRDTLQLITTAAETEEIAKELDDTEGVYLVPAFTGMGAPYWDPHARAAILGMSGRSNRKHIVRAALESVAYQTYDLLQAMNKDSNKSINILRIDGGMSANNWLAQFLADMLHVEIQRSHCIETSALGAAFLAGLQKGVYQSLEDIASYWQMDTSFHAHISEQKRQALYNGWENSVSRIVSSCR